MVSFDELPNTLAITVKLARGGDTNAVADGYLVVGLSEPKGKKKTEAEPSKGSKGDGGGEKAKPKKTIAPKDPVIDTPEPRSAEEKKKVDLLKSVAQKDLNQFLSDPKSKISRRMNHLPPVEREEAKNQMLDIMASGGNEDEIYNSFGKVLHEAEIKVLKKLSGQRD
jgi:hypothetical protein